MSGECAAYVAAHAPTKRNSVRDDLASPGKAAADMSEDLYLANRDRLVSGIEDTGRILSDLRDFSMAQWVVRYPSSDASDNTITSPLSVLRLDLKLGAVGSSNTLVDSLEKSSVGQLLDDRMQRSMSHLDNLHLRITDTQSKVLVTGDLNAGKSTFVNALLRRKMVPTDQQPCTSAFCEVYDAVRDNDGREEVHIVRPDARYDAADPSTYAKHSFSELEAIFNSIDTAAIAGKAESMVVKCYCKDARASQDSLLHNGAVDIALIDAPGLNRDSVKTTAVFAREEQIDVVVFVVSAENHFTLSACEFLQNASNDKAYVFVVVNKYNQIKNKEKCHRTVLEQLRELSPRTYDDASELVHFVDSEEVCNDTADGADAKHSFRALESSLCEFVLLRRAQSKLMPAQTYLLRLLSDIVYLAELNGAAAKKDMEDAREQLAKSRPALSECESNAAKSQRLVEGEEDRVVADVLDATEAAMTDALERLGRGECVHASVELPAYPGLFNLWEYAQGVRYALAESLQKAVLEAEDASRKATTTAVGRIRSMGDAHLPQETTLPDRIFVPEAMFSKKRAGGELGSTHFAGLGVSADIVSVRVTDIFDVKHHLTAVMRMADRSSGSKHADEKSLVPGVSMGLGALTLVGSRTLGLKTAMEAFVRVTDILGSKVVRRWAGPVLLMAGVGMVAWFVVDLPNAVPRNVGRSLKHELVSGEGLSDPGRGNSLMRTSADVFSALQGVRITRETRKVLRLASWDLQEKFRVAIAKRQSDVERAEEQEKVAIMALDWFSSTQDKSVSLSLRMQRAIDFTSA